MATNVLDPKVRGSLAWATFFTTLTPDLKHALADVNAIAPSRVAACWATVFPIDEHGVGGKNGYQPEGYWFKQAGRASRVVAWAESPVLDGDERPALFLKVQPFPIPDSARPLMSSHTIGMRVAWCVGIRLARLALTSRWARFALVSIDQAYGFALDHHVGYVAHDLSDEETVYEVARWHPFGQEG